MNARRRIFRYETKWALEEDGEQTVKLAWQNRKFSFSCQTNLQSKLVYYSKEILKWLAKKKKKISKQELEEKFALLKTFHTNPSLIWLKLNSLKRKLIIGLNQMI